MDLQNQNHYGGTDDYNFIDANDNKTNLEKKLSNRSTGKSEKFASPLKNAANFRRGVPASCGSGERREFRETGNVSFEGE